MKDKVPNIKTNQKRKKTCNGDLILNVETGLSVYNG